KFLPRDGRARSVYQALEDARIEAIGTENYPGAASNIETTLRHEAKRQKLDSVQGMDDAPLAEALRYLSHEAFTGRKPPKEAQKTIKVWKDRIAEHLGSEGLDALAKSVSDQEKFAKLAQQIIDRLDMPSAPAEP